MKEVKILSKIFRSKLARLMPICVRGRRAPEVPPCSKRKNSAREQNPEATARESNSPKAPPS